MLHQARGQRYARPPCPYPPKPSHDGYQANFPSHPSRRGTFLNHSNVQARAPRPPHYRAPPRHPPRSDPFPHPRPRPHRNSHPFPRPDPRHLSRLDLLPGRPAPPPPRHLLPSKTGTNHGQPYEPFVMQPSQEYFGEQHEQEHPPKFYDPYTTNEEKPGETVYETTQTQELTFVKNKSDAYAEGPWVAGSVEITHEPIVKNKELDDWVPASKDTRLTRNLGSDDEENGAGECESSVSHAQYEAWRRSKGVGMKGGIGTKRKVGKVPKGVFTAAGKHPIGALKEKIPTCEFSEEARERYDELKFWKLTGSVKFTGYKFIGYGVTIKIARAEAAVKALTFLDVEGLHEMNPHLTPEYEYKQSLLESVMSEEAEENRIEEPWYIKLDEEGDLDTPVFRPKADPTPETHPTMFLNQWYGPDIKYEYAEENPGFRPLIFSCTLHIQGRCYQGQAPSKKEAQRITAALTLRQLELNPPPIDNRNRLKKKKKNKSKSAASKRPKFAGVADLPTLPSQMPTVDETFVPAEKADNNIVAEVTSGKTEPITAMEVSEILTRPKETTGQTSVNAEPAAKTVQSNLKSAANLKSAVKPGNPGTKAGSNNNKRSDFGGNVKNTKSSNSNYSDHRSGSSASYSKPATSDRPANYSNNSTSYQASSYSTTSYPTSYAGGAATGYAGSAAAYTGSAAAYTGSAAAYTGSAADYTESTAGYAATPTAYSAVAAGYAAGATAGYSAYGGSAYTQGWSAAPSPVPSYGTGYSAPTYQPSQWTPPLPPGPPPR